MIDSTVSIMSVSAVSDINIRNVSRFQLKIKITALATNQCFIGFKFLRDSQQIPFEKMLTAKPLSPFCPTGPVSREN